MKLIIDINEDVRIAISRMGLLRIPDEMQKKVDEAIQRGTPISDNATNGDVIKAIFPQVIIPSEDRATIHCYIENQVTEFTSMSMKEWWNAPYQKGGKK